MSDQAKVAPENSKEPAKQSPEDAEKLQNGPIDKRSCTDILFCLLFIGNVVVMIYIAAYGVANGEPLLLTAVYQSPSTFITYDENGTVIKNETVDYTCNFDLPDHKYLYFPKPHPDYLNHTTCVKECPKSDNETVDCVINDYVYACSSTLNYTWLVQQFATSTDNPDFKDIITSLFIVYKTDVLLDRICIPSSEFLTNIPAVKKAMSDSLQKGADLLQQWFGDLKVSWPVIAGSVGIAFGLGLIYMLFIRLFSGVIVWVCILGYFAALIALAVLCYMKGKGIKDLSEVDGEDLEDLSSQDMMSTGANSDENAQTYLITSYVLFAIVGVSFIGFLCMYRNIKLAIAIIKTATCYVAETPLVMLVPPVFVIVNCGFWVFWIIFAIYVYSCGDVRKRDDLPFAQVEHTQEQSGFIWYFIFGGLWINAFIQAVSQFILASTACIWYFSQGPGQEVHKPISRSLFRAFRYHLGSLAFGAFILAVVQFIRIILEYITQQAKKTGADKNKCFKYILNCLRCYMACFERFIKFLNRNAYIQIALSGRNFCSAAKEAMRMIWNNPTRLALVNGLGGAFIGIGKLFIIVVDVIICYEILTSVEPYKSELTSAFLPCILIFFIGYAIATIFMSVYGMGIDAILMCFLYDEEAQKGKGNARPAHCPDLLHEFFEKNDSTKVQNISK